jgi:hypothetical protein
MYAGQEVTYPMLLATHCGIELTVSSTRNISQV